MESLESKLDRLTPEQRKEIEDFVDFLLSRSVPTGFPVPALAAAPPVLTAEPPLLAGTEPMHGGEEGSGLLQDSCHPDDLATPADWDGPASSPDPEIRYRTERITHDYADYRDLDRQPSPAADAVIKVKRKIIAKQEQEKPHHLLDWVD